MTISYGLSADNELPSRSFALSARTCSIFSTQLLTLRSSCIRTDLHSFLSAILSYWQYSRFLVEMLRSATVTSGSIGKGVQYARSQVWKWASTPCLFVFHHYFPLLLLLLGFCDSIARCSQNTSYTVLWTLCNIQYSRLPGKSYNSALLDATWLYSGVDRGASSRSRLQALPNSTLQHALLTAC